MKQLLAGIARAFQMVEKDPCGGLRLGGEWNAGLLKTSILLVGFPAMFGAALLVCV